MPVFIDPITNTVGVGPGPLTTGDRAKLRLWLSAMKAGGANTPSTRAVESLLEGGGVTPSAVTGIVGREERLGTRILRGREGVPTTTTERVARPSTKVREAFRRVASGKGVEITDLSKRFEFQRGSRLDLAAATLFGGSVTVFRKRDLKPIKVALFQTFERPGMSQRFAVLAGTDRVYVLKRGFIRSDVRTVFDFPVRNTRLTIVSYDILGLSPRVEAGPNFAGMNKSLISWKLNRIPVAGVQIPRAIFKAQKLAEDI